MRKKMLAAAAALVMAAVMATSAFAATSSVTLSDGTNVSVGGSNVTGVVDLDLTSPVGGVDKGTVAAGASAIIEAAGIELDSTKINVANSTVAAVMNIEGSGAGEVTIKVEGLKDGDKCAVLHYVGSSWIVEGYATVTNGTITVNFRSLSPVIVLAEKVSTPAPTTPPAGSTDDDEDTSSSAPVTQATTPAPVLAPQTGVNSAETLAAAVVVAGVAVVAFAAKKIKE